MKYNNIPTTKGRLLHIIFNKKEVEAILSLTHKNHLKIAKELRKIMIDYLNLEVKDGAKR